MSEKIRKSADKEVLVYGFGYAGLRAIIALFKMGYKSRLLLRGSYINAIPNQALEQLPLDMCYACIYMPLKMPLGMGKLNLEFNSELISIDGEEGDFKVKFRSQEPAVNFLQCIECQKCVEVCPVQYKDAQGNDRKAISMVHLTAWENAFVIDFDTCTECGECVTVCPANCINLESAPVEKEVEVGAILLAPEYEQVDPRLLEQFGYGTSVDVVRNSDIAQAMLPDMMARDVYRRPSTGDYPAKVAIVVTPQLGVEEKDFDFHYAAVFAAHRANLMSDLFPDIDIKIFARHFPMSGIRRWQEYGKAKLKGVHFERVDALRWNKGDTKPILNITYTEGNTRVEEFDLVILVTGQKPPSDTIQAQEAVKIAGLSFNDTGFASTIDNSKIRTARQGIYALGEFSGPKGNLESLFDGYSVAADIRAQFGAPDVMPVPSPTLRNIRDEVPQSQVVLCNCGGELSPYIDFIQLEERVRKLPGVIGVKTVTLMCLPEGINQAIGAIKSSGANRVVFAACGTMVKGGRFQKIMLGAGLSPSLMQVIRFREDIAWGVGNVPGNLDKAVREIAAGVVFANRSQPYGMEMTDVVQRALVIGGGLAGNTVALALARTGIPVDIIEKSDHFGGAASLAANPESELRCLITNLNEKVQSNENITVYTSASLEKVDGGVTNWEVSFSSADVPHKEVYGLIIPAMGVTGWLPEKGRFGYKESHNILTLRDFQQRTAYGEKFKGKIVFIQCVGSRNQEHPYCSRSCCYRSAQSALDLKKKGDQPVIIYRDLALQGDFRKLEVELVNSGIELIRVADDDMDKVVEVTVQKQLSVQAKTMGGETYQTEADWIILATAYEPHKESADIARLLGKKTSETGFWVSERDSVPFEEATKRSKPFEIQFGGILAAGTCTGPLTWKEVQHHALSVAGMALHVLTKKKLPPPWFWNSTSTTERFCAGCGICVDVCPFFAREIDPIRKIAIVYPALCEACGACTVACPSNAALVRNFEPKQVFAAIDELLLPREESINA